MATIILLISVGAFSNSYGAANSVIGGGGYTYAKACQGAANVVVGEFTMTAGTTANDRRITNWSFVAAGGYTAGDVTKYQVWYNTTSGTGATITGGILVAGATQLGGNATTALTSGTTITTTAFGAVTLTSGGTYTVYVTATLSPAAVSGDVIGVAAINPTSATKPFTMASGIAVAGTSTASPGITVATNPSGVSATATPNPVCVGGTLTLTGAATSALTYAWVGPGGTAIASPTSEITGVNGVVAGNAGVYTLTATNGSCAVSATTAAVAVNAYPTGVTATATPNPICNGSNLTLTGTATGATTYAWTEPGGTAITAPTALSTGVTGVVPGNAGVYTLTASTPGCAVTVTTASVIVILAPTAILGVPEVCVSSTTSLSDAVGGGTWSSVTPSVATIGSSTGIANGVAQGTSVISYTTGCGAGASVTVTVNEAPSPIAGVTTVCQGSTTSLSDVATNGTWSSSSITVATITTAGIVSGVSGGVSVISYSTGCGSDVGTIVTVTPIPAAISGTLTVCQGSTTSLSDAAGGGTWSSSNTAVATVGSTGIVFGAGGGSTSVISYITGCGAPATVTVTVSTPPTTITGPATFVCTGNSITLVDGTSGGVWTSSDGTIASVGTSGIVNGLLQGTAIIYYTTASCAPASYAITVNPYPAAISGVTEVCVGSTVTLSDITSAGTWSSSLPGTGTVDPTLGIVGGISPGPVTIYYTVSGCAVSQPMTVNPLPAAISGNPIVCLGSTTTLNDISGGGTWSSNNSFVASVGSATGVVSGAALGSTDISYTFTSTGCYVTYPETVDVNPPAISGASSVCLGATTHLIDGSTPGTWSSSLPATASIGSVSGLVTGHALGTATISYTLSTGCFTTETMTVNPNPGSISGPVVVCTGSTITLIDGTPGGTWSSAEYWIASIGSSSGSVSGLTAGATTTISYTLGTGCFATYTDSVVTQPSAIMGDSTICVGNTSVLSDSVNGGVWSSAAPGSLSITSAGGSMTGYAIALVGVAITYSITGCPAVTYNVTVNPVPQPIVGPSSFCDSVHANLYDFTPGGIWSSNDSITARIVNYPDSGVVIGVSLGTTTISYTLSTGCYAILPVTVNPLAPPISGTDTICAGGTAWLTDIVDTATWTSSNPAVASISDSGYLVGLVPGVTFIVYTLPTGCSASLLETVIPPVSTILGPSEVCSGAVADFSDATSGGVWSSANIYTARIVDTTGVLTAAYPGSVTISYIVSAFKGCYTTTSVVINPLPSPVVTYNFAVPSVSTSLGYISYQWHNDLIGIIPGAINPTYVLPDYNDSLYVVVTDSAGCTDSSSWFYNSFTSVNNVTTANVRVYPNPASNTLFIDADVKVKATLSGIDGKVIMEQANAKELNISTFTPGIYMLVLYDDEGKTILTQKVIKE